MNYGSFLSSVPPNIKIIAISKTQPVDAIIRVYNEGCRNFGENKVQELILKKPELPDDIKWHMVGHLQSNKVKYIAPFIDLIHSVDNFNLLKVINKEGEKNNRTIDVLLQVHIAEEETKFGLSSEELHDLLSDPEFNILKSIKVKGLMGMATFTDDKKKIRSEFRNLAEIFNKVKQTFFKNISYFTEISMGMSNDYQIAIEEGATIIRIGTLIFGERNYQ